MKMSTMYENLRLSLKESMKSGDIELKDNVRLILGELSRGSKDPDDAEVLAVLKKLKKLESEALGYKGEITSSFLRYVESLLPQQVTTEEIADWITENVDFGSLRNKMQAVGLVMKHFGSTTDGKMVKDIIANMEV